MHSLYMRQLFLAISIPVLSLLLPEIWKDEFDWLRQSPYWRYVQGGCLLWIIAVLMVTAPWPSLRRWGQDHTALSAIVAALIGAAAVGGAWLLFVRIPAAPANRPIDIGLSVVIDQAQLSEITSPTGERIPLLALVVSVRNTGAPTVVEGYETKVRLADGTEIATEPVVMPSQMTLRHNDGTGETIYGADAIEKKTIVPVQPGTVVRGRLISFVRGLSYDALVESLGGGTILLRYTDGARKVYTAALSNARRGADNIRFPGLTYAPDGTPSAQ